MSDNTELSGREREILYLVAKGASNKEIASALYISTNTVKVHLRNIFSKIGANSRTEAAMLAIGAGMVEVPPGRRDVTEVLNEDGTAVLEAGAEARVKATGIRRNFPLYAGLGLVGISLLILFGFLLSSQILRGQVNAAGELPTGNIETGWQANAPLPTARQGMALSVIGNQVYVIGGDNGSGVTGIMHRYDTVADSWETLSSKPSPVTDIQAAVIGGQIYIPGGQTESGDTTALLEIYDPLTDSWGEGHPLPAAVSGYTLVTFEGKMILFGGWDGEQVVNSVFEYNPDLNEWSIRSPMPTARSLAGSAVAGGKVFVFGGYDGQNALSTNEVYTPSNERGSEPAWSTADSLPSPRYGMGVASLADTIHVVGGIGSVDAPMASLQFSALTEEWEIFESPLIGTWSRLGVGATSTHIYLIGGFLNGEPTSNNLSYKVIYLINLPVIR